MSASPKELVWVASSLKDLRAFPDEVRQAAKPLKGYRGAGVLEVVDDFDGDTYRTVYTVRFSDTMYVLHAVQKKSKRGAATPKRDIEIVGARLKLARQVHTKRSAQWRGDPE